MIALLGLVIFIGLVIYGKSEEKKGRKIPMWPVDKYNKKRFRR